MRSNSSAKAWLCEAVSLERANRETQAIPLYRRALALGLEGNDLHAALVGLGSSLRTTGQSKASIRTLQKARRLFPGDVTIMLCLALAHHDGGQVKLAIRQLGHALLKESRQPRLASHRAALARAFHACR